MTFNWTDYYQLSNHLLNNRPAHLDEATFRCAISRSYYAAFCSARDWAAGRNKITLSGKAVDHKTVKDYFIQSHNADEQKIGIWLDRLRDQRNDADYETQMTVTQGAAIQATTKTGSLINLLGRLP